MKELKPGEYIEESKEFTLNDFKRVEKQMEKLSISTDYNIVMNWAIDTTSNFTNQFEYNFAICIYDVRGIGEKVSDKKKREKAIVLFRKLQEFFENEMNHKFKHAYGRGFNLEKEQK